MGTSFSNRSPTLKWAVVVVISVFLGIAASCDLFVDTKVDITAGSDTDVSAITDKRVSEAVQNTPECKTAESCKNCGSNPAWTPCCVKNEKSGKSYCSCGSSSSESNACPQLLMTTVAKAANGNGNVGPFGIGASSSQADITTIQVYYRTGGFTLPDQLVTYSLNGDDLEVSITAATQTDTPQIVVIHNLRLQSVAIKIAQEYLKTLGSEEIIRFLDKEIVQQVVERYSSEILDSKVMGMN